MYEVRVVAAGREGGADDGAEVGRRPGGLFGVLDDDGVASEQGGYDRAEEVVEGVAVAQLSAIEACATVSQGSKVLHP